MKTTHAKGEIIKKRATDYLTEGVQYLNIQDVHT